MFAVSSLLLAAEDAVQTTNTLGAVLKDTQTALVNSFVNARDVFVSRAPTFIAAVVVFVVGVIFARLVGRVVSMICDKLGLHATAEKSGLAGSMRQVGITRSVPQVVGTIVFWTLTWVVLLAACQIVGLSQAEAQIQRFFTFIPSLFVASIVLVAGLLLATFLKGVAAAGMDRVGLTYGPQLATMVYWVLVIMTINTAAEQLGLNATLFDWTLKTMVVALAAALGLSFGLGGRDVMAGILAGYYLRQRFASGDPVSVAGFEGHVREVGPVATVIETEEQGLVHRHSIPNSKMLSEAVR